MKDFFNDFYKEQIKEIEKDLPEDILKKYNIVECIACTENSSIYLIEHKKLKSNFIMKIYANTYQENEYQTLSKLNHPSVPKIIDIFSYNQKTITILEYFQGKTLDRLIEESNYISLDKLKSLFIKICQVLDFLHSQNIIHRDIKPSNIIIDANNNIKILDYGCAREQSKDKEKDTRLLGTHGYASPEQYGFSQTDQRTDIYALGVLISEIIEKHNIKTDYKFKNIIEKCKKIDPDQRYNNVSEILDDLKDNKNNSNEFLISRQKLYIFFILLLIFSAFIYMTNSRKYYEFHSQIIAEAVSEKLNKDPQNISLEDLENIKEISIWGENIISPEDEIVWESNPGNYVSSIIINGSAYNKRGEIDSLEDFRNMKNLKSLSLVKQDIKDLSPIKDLKIVHLFLNDNFIEDISPIQDMQSLYTLEIGGSPIENLNPLISANNIAELDISSTCSSIDFLKDMTNLKELIAKNLKVQDLGALKNLYKLEKLNLENNRISKINDIVNLENLEYLNIASNPIDDFERINSMESLNYLVIRDTKLREDNIRKDIAILQD